MDAECITVLIVENHAATRLGLRFALESFGDIAVVGETADGMESVTLSAELRPNVVIMDFGLPGMSGIEAARLIKSVEQPPALLMTTVSDDMDTIFAAFSVGAQGYCLKSARSAQIAMAVRTVHAGALWLDAKIGRLVVRTVLEQPELTPPNVPIVATSGKFALSPREVQILELLVDGLSNNQIAERLQIGSETVKTHVRHVMDKLLVSDRTQAAVKAVREGMVQQQKPPSEDLPG